MANWKITTGYSIVYEYVQGAPTYGSGTFTIASTANEQTAPTSTLYVAKWGNDTTGNGSRDRPYLTIAKACLGSTSGNRLIVIGTGVYRESCSVGNNTGGVIFVGDGNVVIEGTGLSNLLSNLQGGYTFDNLTIQNFQNIGGGATQYTVKLTNCRIFNCTTVENRSLYSKNNVFVNINRLFDNTANGMTSAPAFSRYFINNTFVNIKNVDFIQNTNSNFSLIYNVFKNCNIQFRTATNSDYCLYHNCNFRFNASAGTQPTSLPEDSGNTYVPSGWMSTRPTTPSAIQAGQVAAGFGGIGFSNSLVADPLFNNASIFDFTLQTTSPARNLAYEGTFVGAKSIGMPLKFRTTEANGDWKNSLATNLTITDDSAVLTTDNTALIESNVIDLGVETVLRAISIQQILGDRNGEWVDTDTDLDSVTTASGSNLLVANASYVVEGGTVTYNGTLYQIDQKFAVVSGVTDYTPTGGGVVRKIVATPNRVCYEMRFSNISSADVASQTYFKYEDLVQPTVNRTGNVSTGAITKGNGDITFDRTTANVFIVSARYIQLRLTVQNNNLR